MGPDVIFLVISFNKVMFFCVWEKNLKKLWHTSLSLSLSLIFITKQNDHFSFVFLKWNILSLDSSLCQYGIHPHKKLTYFLEQQLHRTS